MCQTPWILCKQHLRKLAVLGPTACHAIYSRRYSSIPGRVPRPRDEESRAGAARVELGVHPGLCLSPPSLLLSWLLGMEATMLGTSGFPALASHPRVEWVTLLSQFEVLPPLLGAARGNQQKPGIPGASAPSQPFSATPHRPQVLPAPLTPLSITVLQLQVSEQ